MISTMAATGLIGKCCLLFFALLVNNGVRGATRSFTIDYEKNTFLKDGKPFRYISGSIHYSRVPHYYWEDRLEKMYAAGLDAVQVYVPWNFHEPQPGQYEFAGDHDIISFLQRANKIGLLVILRAGPYICGEWEYGGFPSWILKNNGSIRVRTMDPEYIGFVDNWFDVLLPKIKPMLYANGGPVIMVQVENEYGSFRSVDCGHDYMGHLRDEFKKHLGKDAVLFTTDGSGLDYLKCGAIDGVFATVDFGTGSNMSANFDPMRQWNKNKGPLVNSEFYTGWLDHWGGGHAHTPTANIISSLKQILDLGASVNMYMFEGGTNFGYTNGADPGYSLCPTSYDYDAPLTEAGDTTPKYDAIRNFILKYKKLAPIPVPKNAVKYAYGKVQMSKMSTVIGALKSVGPAKPTTSMYPLSMEQVDQIGGFIMYRHVFQESSPVATFSVPGIRDRGYVLLDGRPVGLAFEFAQTSFMMMAKKGQVLDIIVENQGRVNFGAQIIGQRKGIVGNVTFSSRILTNWEIYPLNFTQVFKQLETQRNYLQFRPQAASVPSAFLQPTLYTGTFTAPSNLQEPEDTYLSMCGWWKGQAFINGFNLGRYWPSLGPQVTLYVPKGVIKPFPAKNTLVMVELESAPCDNSQTCYVTMTDVPDIGGKCYDPKDREYVPLREVTGNRNRGQ